MGIFEVAGLICVAVLCAPSARSQGMSTSEPLPQGESFHEEWRVSTFNLAVALPISSSVTLEREVEPGNPTPSWCPFIWPQSPALEQQTAQSTGTNPSQQANPATPQSGDQNPQSSEAAKPAALAKEKTKPLPRGALVAAPIPISSPAIGSGVVLAGGYIFPWSKKDKLSPPSVVGAAGLFTSNGTRGFAVGGQIYLEEDRYEITSAYARGNINYDLYGSGAFSGIQLPLKQTGQVFLGEFLRRIGWNFFLGPRFITGRSVLTLRPSDVTNFPLSPLPGLDTALTAVGARLTRDTRRNRFYPTNGTFFTLTSDFFSQTLGSKYSFQSYRMAFAKYWSLGGKQVLAYNSFVCVTGGSPPFYANCVYGANSQLRGYISGKYFDRYMLTTQVEYRQVLPLRLGFVLFGGVGEAIPGGNQLLFRNNVFLPAGGGGLRFDLSKRYHVNLRADIAQGTDGHTFALGIGEAF